MPLIYTVWIADEKADRDDDAAWVSFESEEISHNLLTKRGFLAARGPADAPLKSLAVATHEFNKIRVHKQMRATADKDKITIHALHFLLAAWRDHTNVRVIIDLRQVPDTAPQDVGQILADVEFVGRVTLVAPTAQDTFNFNFQIIRAFEVEEIAP